MSLHRFCRWFSLPPTEVRDEYIDIHKVFQHIAKFSPDVSPRLLCTNPPKWVYRVSNLLFLQYNQIFFLQKSGLHSEELHPARGVASSGFPPLRTIPNCCLP